MANTESKIKLVLDGEDRGVGKAANSAGDAVRKLGSEVGKASAEIGKGAESGVGKFEASLGKLKAAAAVGGAAVGAGLTMAFAKSMEFESANAKLEAQMGGASDLSRAAGEVAGKLYAGAYGESLGEVGDAVRQVLQSGAVMEDVTNEQLQSITGNVMSLSQAFGQDLTGTINAVGQMVRTGLAKDAPEALDLLTRGFQQGNDKAGDLLDTMNEYGTQFRKVGLSGADAMGLISQGLQHGARDADIVADAIKEFSIRAIDGSKSTAAAFDDMGLSQAKIVTAMKKGGPEARAALGLVLDRLREMPPSSERAADAVGLFGTQAEDLGDALYSLDLDTAAQGMGNIDGAAQKLNDTLGDTAANKIESVKRGFEQWGAKLVEIKGPVGDVGAMVAAFGPQAVSTLAPLGSMLAALRMQGAVGALAATKVEVAAVGTAADVSTVKAGKLAGALKGIGLAGAGIAATIALDDILPKDAAKTWGTQVARDMLHEMSTVFQGGGSAFQTLNVAQWISNPLSMAVEVGKRKLMELFGVKPPPIGVEVDTKKGEDGVKALADMVAHQKAVMRIDGDVDPVTGKITQSVKLADGSTGVITVDGEASPVNGKINSSIRFADGSTGTIDIDGNQQPVNGKIKATVTYGNGQVVTILVNAATQQALHDIAVASQNRTMTITAIVRQRALPPGHTAATGGAVIGGSVVRGFAPGGPVSGPGTGTSDTAGLFALSDGEYVANAKNVRNAGGAAAFGRLMDALDRGRVPGFASGGGVGDKVTWGSVSAKVWNQLLAQGWKGRAGDNQEALYRPMAKALVPVTKALGDVVKWGSVSAKVWDQLLAQGWRGRAGDKQEALYRPVLQALGDVVKWGQVTTAKWDALIAAGWRGRAGDGQEALYRPVVKTGLSGAIGELASRLAEGGSVFEDLSFRGMSSNLGKYNDQLADMFYKQNSGFDVKALAGWLRKQQGSSGGSSGSGGATVTFTGNTSDALATTIMQMVRTGKIQIKAA